MTTFSVPSPRPAVRRRDALGISLPNLKRRFTPGAGPRIARSTFVPRSLSSEPKRA
ncbi:hypothetical protein [Schumannella luteola]